jgi:hypothetical protein
MKKIIIIISSILLTVTACKKDYDTVSQVQTESYATITLTGSQFYSIKVGDPAPTVEATAYDSTIKESYTTELDPSGIDNETPGLYIVPVKTKNKYGYESSINVYVAVTDIGDDVDLSGTYERTATGGIANITKVSRGLYETDNVGGNAGASTHAYFVQTAADEIIIPDQPTTDGVLAFPTFEFEFDESGVLTSYAYTIDNPGYGTAVRTFTRQ